MATPASNFYDLPVKDFIGRPAFGGKGLTALKGSVILDPLGPLSQNSKVSIKWIEAWYANPSHTNPTCNPYPVVNIASKCGLAPQMQELEQLYTKYKDRGFVVLGFPSNSFAQEPLDGAAMCVGVTFPVMEKCEVNGANTHPVFKYLKDAKPTAGVLGLFTFNRITWNYEKFLVDREGRVFDRYIPTTTPLAMEADIKKLLDASPRPSSTSSE